MTAPMQSERATAGTRRNSGSSRTSLAHRVRSLMIGATLIGIGLLGLLLPILPGWILILGGVVALAGAVPALKALVSRVVTSRVAQRVIDETSKSEKGRRLIARALKMEPLRRGLTTSSRWLITRLVLRRSANTQDQGEQPGSTK
jgi:uncharacterized membrane protein YbaN (DUF454 family)